MRGALVGKPAGCFFSSSIQGGGQETMGLTMVPFFTHMGMVYVPLGFVETMFNMDEVHGASAYGSGTFAGVDGSRQPTALEKSIAVAHGTKFAKVAAKLASE
jgi:NAD(P)H dehydrogenase (quinone)